ncbi:MAG: hypothetical protein L3J47_00635 [Sulfurovum sp.]|nr:hypothetical protein [Sulfurovum sp.]
MANKTNDKEGSNLTSRAYVYAVLPPESQEDRDHLDNVMYLSHRAKNHHTQLRNTKREAQRDVNVRVSTAYAALSKKTDILAKKIDGKYEERASLRSAARKKSGVGEALSKDIAELSKERSALYKELAKVRKAFTKEEKAKAKEEFSKISKEFFKSAKSGYRKLCTEEGLNSNTWYFVNQAGAKSEKTLKFGRNFKYLAYEDDSFIAIQCKSTTDSLLTGKKCVRIEAPVHDPSKGKMLNSRATLVFQVGQNSLKRSIRFLMVYHRPLPKDGYVDSARLFRDKRGRLKVLFLVKADHSKKKTKSGKVSVDVCTTWLPDGGIRIATYIDSKGKRGELVLPGGVSRDGLTKRTILSTYTHASDIQSVLSDKANLLKKELASWYKSTNNDLLPEWFEDQYKKVSHSRSSRKMFRFVRFWKNNRFKGDSKIFGRKKPNSEKNHSSYVEGSVLWYYHMYRHLQPYYLGDQASITERRKSAYREFAAMLTNSYKSIKVAVTKPDGVGVPRDVFSSTTRVAAQASVLTAIQSAANIRGVAVSTKK